MMSKVQTKNPVPKPAVKPARPYFSSGPCAKYPGWSPKNYEKAFLGRSHRASVSLEEMHDVVTMTREILNIPHNYKVAIMPGSATGAIEAAMWNLLGARHLVVLSHDVFSQRWEMDVRNHLCLEDADFRNAPHGQLPDVENISGTSDILMNWNGSTSGVKFPNTQFISHSRPGLVICDVTSAAFTTAIPWKVLDAVAFSWQKGMGGEAGHGILVLSPKAIERINTYKPKWPIPYIFKLRNENGFYNPLFEEKTLNTPSMLCVHDAKQALLWAKSLESFHTKARDVLIERSRSNFIAVSSFVAKSDQFALMCEDKKCTSTSTIVLKVTDPRVTALDTEGQWEILKDMCALLAEEKAGFEVLNHTGAPPSLRIWGGPTVNTEDIDALLPWLPWALEQQFL